MGTEQIFAALLSSGALHPFYQLYVTISRVTQCGGFTLYIFYLCFIHVTGEILLPANLSQWLLS